MHTRSWLGLSPLWLQMRATPPRMDSGEQQNLHLPLYIGRPLQTPEAKRNGLALSVLKSISEVPSAQWDACVAGSCRGAPFLQHSFLAALEASKSAHHSHGWMPQHLVAHDRAGRLVGAVPLYLKSHSYGEYVYDESWARAYRSTLRDQQTISSYYPKLQACVPFTPVTGSRLLVAEAEPARRVELQRMLARGLIVLSDRLGVSGVHVTYNTREEGRVLRRVGFLPRLGIQYHWSSRGKNYSSFDDYLSSLKQSRRKSIRRERRKVADAGLVVTRLRGAQIEPRHWAAFYSFYRNTIEHKSVLVHARARHVARVRVLLACTHTCPHAFTGGGRITSSAASSTR